MKRTLSLFVLLAAFAHAQPDPVIAGSNRFAVNLYQQLANEDNLFFSPLSISLALGMTYAGAAGETAAQMADVLNVNNATDMADVLGSLSDDLETREGFTLNVANALWGQQGRPFEPRFLLTARTDYGATLRNLDFQNASAEARNTINDWVERETEGIIRDLLPANAITPDTRLVLTNAIYFNAAWQFPFSVNNTEDSPFTTLAGGQVRVPMMQQTRMFAYSRGDDYQTLQLPYVGSSVSLLVVLPTAGRFAEVASQLETVLAEAMSGQQAARVNLELPRFTVRSKSDLATNLTRLGMLAAFTPYQPAADCEMADAGSDTGSGADFSNMDGTRCLYIDAVIHEAYIDVDEVRTEAAAATAVAMARTTSLNRQPPINFIVNRPFLFAIRDDVSGALLFLGQVTDPTR